MNYLHVTQNKNIQHLIVELWIDNGDKKLEIRSLVKLEDIIVCTDYDWLSSGQKPLHVCSWENCLSHWLRKFPHVYIRPKVRDICSDCLVLHNYLKHNKDTLDT